MSTMLAEKHGIRVNAVAPGPIWCAAAERMQEFLLFKCDTAGTPDSLHLTAAAALPTRFENAGTI
jgi:NAD(P)-dependent dehydrogenase (short-subunit alcohol dehydrogenase family)